MHQNEKKLTAQNQVIEEKCPNKKCGRNLIMTSVGKWCPNPDCYVMRVK